MLIRRRSGILGVVVALAASTLVAGSGDAASAAPPVASVARDRAPAPLTASGSWLAVAQATAAGQTVGDLAGVSCVTVTQCMAVGAGSDIAGNRVPLAEWWDGTRWTVTAVPTPPVSGDDVLDSVSCVSTTSCIAVGSQGTMNQGPSTPLAEKWDGTTWTLESTPSSLPTASTEVSLTSVSCASTTMCMATAGSFTEEWNGSTWTVDDVGPSANLTSVSCASTIDCVAVGAGPGSRPSTSVPVAWEWNGSSWAATATAPVPYSAAFDAVSCWAPGSCIAVGTATARSHTAFEEVLQSGTWTLSASPPATSRGRLAPTSWALSCTSLTSCVAIGTTFNASHTVSSVLAGTTWTVGALPRSSASGYFPGVSCAAPQQCVAVGTLPLKGTDWLQVAKAYTLAGTTWSDSAAVSPPGYDRASLGPAACPSATTCMALGTTGAPLSAYSISSADGWSAQTAIPPPVAGNIELQFTSMSCPSSTQCVAVGYYNPAEQFDDQQPLYATWNGSSWSDTTVALPTGQTTGYFQSVACPAVDDCVAVGATDLSTAVTGWAATWNGTGWSTSSTSSLDSEYLEWLACPTTTWCMALGLGTTTALSEATFDGTSWTRRSQVPSEQFVEPNALACWAQQRCIIVGPSSSGAVGSAVLSGLSWSYPTTPDPSGGAGATLSSISCSSATSCVAVGSGPSAMIWNGSAWSVDNPSTAGFDPPNGYLDSVACTATGCVAVGDTPAFTASRGYFPASYPLLLTGP